MCEALRALHSAGLVHRDLKPANLMLGRDGKVTVVDLGIVQRVTDGHDASGHTVGTPAMAPEMLSDEEVTRLADIYSLGLWVIIVSRASHLSMDPRQWRSCTNRLTKSRHN